METDNSKWEYLAIKFGFAPIGYFINRCCLKEITNKLEYYGIETVNLTVSTKEIHINYRYLTVNGYNNDVKSIVLDYISQVARKTCFIPLNGFLHLPTFDFVRSEVELETAG